MLNIGIQGLIAFPFDSNTYNERILQMKFYNFPLVLLDRTLPGIDTYYVVTHNYQGAELAMTHLYEYGHRHIAFCTTADLAVQTIAERYRGYNDSLRKFQLRLSHDYSIINIQQNYTNFEQNAILMDVICHKRVTALIAADLSVTRYLYVFINRLGFSVPEDFFAYVKSPAMKWDGRALRFCWTLCGISLKSITIL